MTYTILSVSFLAIFALLARYIDAKFGKARGKLPAAIIGVLFALVATWACESALEYGGFDGPQVFAYLAVLWLLCLAFSTDVYAQRIPYPLQIALVLYGFVSATVLSVHGDEGFWGFVLGRFLPALLVAFLCIRVVVFLQDRYGHKLGGGDLVSAIAISFVLGWAVFATILLATFFAFVHGLFAQRTGKVSFPLLPSISLAFAITLVVNGLLSA